MLTRTIKTAALAAAIVVATAGASMAATWAWVDQDAYVRKNHSTSSAKVNTVYEGDKVKVIGQWNNWFKLQLSGPDGWVRHYVLDFGGYDDDDFYPGPGFGSQFCVKGKNAQFCLGAQY
jgi:hypothetical protein